MLTIHLSFMLFQTAVIEENAVLVSEELCMSINNHRMFCSVRHSLNFMMWRCWGGTGRTVIILFISIYLHFWMLAVSVLEV